MYFSIKAVVEKEGNVSLFSNLTNYKWHIETPCGG